MKSKLFRKEIGNVLFIVLVGLIYCSCKKTESLARMQLLFENNSSIFMDVVLYPKPEWLITKTAYDYSDVSGGGRDPHFTLSSGESTEIYDSKDVTQLPSNLFAEIFDSVIVTVDSTVLKFSHDTVIGYPVNIFTDDSVWEYSYTEESRPVGMSRKIDKRHNYTFVFE